MTKALLAAAALIALSGAAFAEDDTASYALDPTLVNQDAGFDAAKSFAGAFHDVFDFVFTGPPAGNVGVATAVHLQINGSPDVDFTKVALNGVIGQVQNQGFSGGTSVSGLFAGPVAGDISNNPAYRLEVWGMASQGAQYGGSLNVAMVPEPGTYAMMLAGLGAVGFLASRRRRG